jgi:hypothetical protein
MSGMSMHGKCSAWAVTPSTLAALNLPPATAPFAQDVMKAMGQLPQNPGSGGEGICRVYGRPALRDARMHAGSA